MNETYLFVYDMLNLPSEAKAIATEKVKLPEDLFHPPLFDVGFPPALIPLWGERANLTHLGLWKHWFVPGRQPSYVRFGVEGEGYVSELGRNFEQFVRILLVELMGEDEEVHDDIATFAEIVGVDDVEELFQFTYETGPYVGALVTLPQFGADSPLACFRNYHGFSKSGVGEAQDGLGYQGDFPHSNMSLTSESLSKVCGFEIRSKMLQERIAELSFKIPAWLNTNEQAHVFYELLEQNDLSGAWLSLNSSGWLFSEAREAILALAEQAQDANFSLLAKAWVEETHGFHKFVTKY